MADEDFVDGAFIGFIVGILTMMVLGLVIFAMTPQTDKFEGYCQALEGTVHDDMCIKDGAVIATLEDLK